MKALTLIPALAVLCAIAGTGPAAAGKSMVEEGAQACVIDKWDVKEPEKGHKLVDYSGRCVYLPDDAAPKASSVCPGKFEYMPDGSYKASGTCEITYAGGDKKTVTWEEGSQMKEKVYKNTGGTGKFAGATGGGTYTSVNITDSTFFGRYSGKAEMP